MRKSFFFVLIYYYYLLMCTPNCGTSLTCFIIVITIIYCSVSFLHWLASCFFPHRSYTFGFLLLHIMRCTHFSAIIYLFTGMTKKKIFSSFYKR